MTDEQYPDRVPCWVDTDQPDVDAARHFYARLFGWTFSDAVPPMRLEVPDRMPSTAPTWRRSGRRRATAVEWNTDIAVGDADAAAASVWRRRHCRAEPSTPAGDRLGEFDARVATGPRGDLVHQPDPFAPRGHR